MQELKEVFPDAFIVFHVDENGKFRGEMKGSEDRQLFENLKKFAYSSTKNWGD